jgi:integrase
LPVSPLKAVTQFISPRLEKMGLGWVNFQVMRPTHSSLMRELDVDPKMVSDQLGHTLDVNLNVYTKSNLASRRDAVNRLEIKLQSFMEQTH